jgi:hypothetical protein
MAFWGFVKGGGGVLAFFWRKGGGTNFSANEKENTRNYGNFVHYRDLEGSKIAQTSCLGPF